MPILRTIYKKMVLSRFDISILERLLMKKLIILIAHEKLLNTHENIDIGANAKFKKMYMKNVELRTKTLKSARNYFFSRKFFFQKLRTKNYFLLKCA